MREGPRAVLEDYMKGSGPWGKDLAVAMAAAKEMLDAPSGASWAYLLIYFDLLIRWWKGRSSGPWEDLKSLFRRRKYWVNANRLESIQPVMAEILRRDGLPGVPEGPGLERPLRILFLQQSPCIRNYKYAYALKRRGHRVTLAYIERPLSERYALSDDVYERSVAIRDFRDFWQLSEGFDLIHSHNEPDTYTVLAAGSSVPTIHDTHDLMSLGPETGHVVNRILECLANKLCTGRVSVSPYLVGQVKGLYGGHDGLTVYNFAVLEKPLSKLPKLSERDGRIHIVYEGGMQLGHSYRDPSELFIELSKHGFHVHVYPATYSEKVEEVFSPHKNIHYERPVSPKDLIQILSQYDLGLIPFSVTEQTREVLNASLGNKLFEYLAAGLPVVAPDLVSYRIFFETYPFGCVFGGTEDLFRRIPEVSRIRAIDRTFLFDGQVADVERFYASCLLRHAVDKEGREEVGQRFRAFYRRNVQRWMTFLRGLKRRGIRNLP
ncbi:MAG: glycosyltransferase [bacterium]